jgi:hypothetical protein
VKCRDRVGLAEAERPEAGRLGLSCRPIDLVGGEDDRLTRPLQDSDHGFISVGGTGPRVDHEEHGVGSLHRKLGLRSNPRGESPSPGVPAPGVDHGEAASAPKRVVGDPVSRDAWAVLDDRVGQLLGVDGVLGSVVRRHRSAP